VAEKIIGVDFGGSGIKLAEVQTAKDSATVLRQVFVPLDRDLVRNGSIKPENIGLVASVLKAALAEHKVLTRDVIMGINSADDVFVNRAVTDWHDPKDFHQAIGFDLLANPNLLPGAPEEVRVDAVVHRDFTDEEGGKHLDVLLVGVNPEIVETQVQILQKAGLNIAGADLTAMAMLRSVQTFSRGDGQLDVLVDIGQEVVSVLIHENGRPYAIRLQKGAGGADADRIIRDAIQDDTPAKIQKLKAAPEAASPQDRARIRPALEDYTFKVYTAIEKAVTGYLNAHPPTEENPASIETITLTGSGSLMPTLAATLSNSFRVPVQIAVFDPTIGGEPVMFQQENAMSTSFTAAVGLAMGVAV
jgi:type IV pilus assembly protein PilM